MKDKKNQLEKLLENELICFKEILYKTQQVSREEDTPSTESLVNLLKYRDNQIELIKKLESDRKSLDTIKNDVSNKERIDFVKKEIKFVALKLVEIDAKMLYLLAMKKEEIVKGLCIHSDNDTRDKSVQSSGKQLIDITLD